MGTAEDQGSEDQGYLGNECLQVCCQQRYKLPRQVRGCVIMKHTCLDNSSNHCSLKSMLDQYHSWAQQVGNCTYSMPKPMIAARPSFRKILIWRPQMTLTGNKARTKSVIAETALRYKRVLVNERQCQKQVSGELTSCNTSQAVLNTRGHTMRFS